MKTIHIHLTVEELDDSVRFYSALLQSEPTLRKPDYAQWILRDPPVNLSVAPGRAGKAGVNHLGIQVQDADELAAVQAAATASEGPVLEEGATTCCYARSTKSWVDDPQGVRWELFHTSERLEEFAEAPQACCSEE